VAFGSSLEPGSPILPPMIGRPRWRWHSAGDLPARLLPGLVLGGAPLVGRPPDEFLGLGRQPVEGLLDEGVVPHHQPGDVRQRSDDPSKSLVGDV
jgi:hypothetical protein